MIKSSKLLIAALSTAFSSFAMAAPYTVPEDGWYQLQNPITLVDACSSMEMTCDVAPGIYTLINHSVSAHHPYHRQTITVAGGSTTPPTHNPQPPTHNPQPPTHNPQPPTNNNAQYAIETTVVTQECQSRFPGRPQSIDELPCVASCPNHYAATGGNCIASIEDSVFVQDSAGNTIGTREVKYRSPTFETPITGGYSCELDTDTLFTPVNADTVRNNLTDTIITVTAICSTIVSK